VHWFYSRESTKEVVTMNEKLSITLPAELVAVIKEQVASGRFASTSDVLEDAMAVWMRDEKALKVVRAKIEASLEDPRLSIPIDEAFDKLHQRIQERLKAG
jgi:antitoxin ParD1/3/4